MVYSERLKLAEEAVAWLQCRDPMASLLPVNIVTALDAMGRIVREEGEVPGPPPRCEHGVPEGDWCPDCREDYRQGRLDQEGESS